MTLTPISSKFKTERGEKMKKVLNRLIYLRKSNILSQKEIAAMLGISQQYYGRLEKKPLDINLGMALKLKEIFKIKSIDEILEAS